MVYIKSWNKNFKVCYSSYCHYHFLAVVAVQVDSQAQDLAA